MLKIENPHLIISSVDITTYPEHDDKEFVLLGRSNVGKSTFINKFCQKKKLAYTSSKPGKTQLLNFFKISENVTLVDVPGYGYASVSKKMREKFGQMIEEYLVNRQNLQFCVLLVDFKVGPTEDDILMYNFLKYYNLKTIVVATKKDKVKKSMYQKHKKILESKLDLADEDELYIYSSEISQDINDVRNTIFKLLEE